MNPGAAYSDKCKRMFGAAVPSAFATQLEAAEAYAALRGPPPESSA